MENQVKKNTIILNGKEISWDYTVCPCLTCEHYLKENKSPDIKICESSRCTYNKQLARDIANDVFFMMHNWHCDGCDLWFNKEDYRDNPCCPNCGNSFR
jgi:hypothetical protein